VSALKALSQASVCNWGEVAAQAEHGGAEDDDGVDREHDEGEPERCERRRAQHHALRDVDEVGERQDVADPADRPRYRRERETG
jgi:hypothetical protein